MSDFDLWKQTINEATDEANIVGQIKSVVTKFLWYNRIPPEIIKREMRNGAEKVMHTLRDFAQALRSAPEPDSRLTPAEIKMLMRPDD